MIRRFLLVAALLPLTACVATKQDVAYLGSRIDRVDERFDRLDAKVDGMSSRFITWLLTSQATVVAATAAMILLD